MKIKALIIPIIIILIIIFTGAYVIDETEQVVITQFGKSIGKPKTAPGLYFKIPVIQQAQLFPPKTCWNGTVTRGRYPPWIKRLFMLIPLARWKIVDPLKFFETVNNVIGAQARLDDIIDPAVRNFITSYPLIETVRNYNRELDTFEVGLGHAKDKDERTLGEVTTGRGKITQGIMAQAQPKLKDFGIELVDVQIKRLNYVEQVQKSVYARMIAERKQIAEKFRSEGEGEARIIEGNRDKELKKITSEAYKTAQEIMGKADAESTLIYAKADDKDPDFLLFCQISGCVPENHGRQEFSAAFNRFGFSEIFQRV